MKKVLAVQRRSHVSTTPFSRTTAARFTEAFDYLRRDGHLDWVEKLEGEITAEDLKGIDAVFLSKPMSEHALRIVRLAAEAEVATVCDFDDWVFDFPEYSFANDTGRLGENVKKILDIATHVTVANERLFYEMRPFRKVLVHVPNGFFADKYDDYLVDEESVPLKVVFTNVDFLKVRQLDIVGVLQEYHKRHPEVEFDFFGDPFPELKQLPFMCDRGSLTYDMHKKTLAGGGYAFGIVPLGGLEDPDTFFFHTCKNPFKYLEYGGLNIPGIYSISPMYENCVQPDVTGMLVENRNDAWLEAMEIMTNDVQLRNAIRTAARKDVMSKRHISFCAEGFCRLI